MSRVVVPVAFVVCSCAVVNAEEPPALPKDVPPVVATAVATASTSPNSDEWSIKLSVPKVKWEIVGEERPKVDWPKFNVTVEGYSLALPMANEQATQLSEIAQNRIFDVKGKRLSREEALERLASSTPVLVSVSGRKPDPFYLQCTKPDTLIVVLGIPYSPAPDLLPQPVSPPEVHDRRQNGEAK